MRGRVPIVLARRGVVLLFVDLDFLTSLCLRRCDLLSGLIYDHGVPGGGESSGLLYSGMQPVLKVVLVAAGRVGGDDLGLVDLVVASASAACWEGEKCVFAGVLGCWATVRGG